MVTMGHRIACLRAILGHMALVEPWSADVQLPVGLLAGAVALLARVALERPRRNRARRRRVPRRPPPHLRRRPARPARLHARPRWRRRDRARRSARRHPVLHGPRHGRREPRTARCSWRRRTPSSPAPAVALVVDPSGPAASPSTCPTGSPPSAAATAPTSMPPATSPVVAYDRASGNQDGQWILPPVRTATTRSARTWSPWSPPAGQGVRLHHPGRHASVCTASTPARRAAPQVGGGQGWVGGGRPATARCSLSRTDHQPGGAVDPDGGATGRPHALAATPNGLGGGVQYVDAVAPAVPSGSASPAGQGLDGAIQHLRRGARSTPSARTAGVGDRHRGRHRSPGRSRSSSPTAAIRPAREPAPNQPNTSCVLQHRQAGNTSDPVGVGGRPVASCAQPGPGGRRVGHGDGAIRPGPPVLSTPGPTADRELGWAISSAWPRRRWG